MGRSADRDLFAEAQRYEGHRTRAHSRPHSRPLPRAQSHLRPSATSHTRPRSVSSQRSWQTCESQDMSSPQQPANRELSADSPEAQTPMTQKSSQKSIKFATPDTGAVLQADRPSPRRIGSYVRTSDGVDGGSTHGSVQGDPSTSTPSSSQEPMRNVAHELSRGRPKKRSPPLAWDTRAYGSELEYEETLQPIASNKAATHFIADDDEPRSRDSKHYHPRRHHSRGERSESKDSHHSKKSKRRSKSRSRSRDDHEKHKHRRHSADPSAINEGPAKLQTKSHHRKKRHPHALDFETEKLDSERRHRKRATTESHVNSSDIQMPKTAILSSRSRAQSNTRPHAGSASSSGNQSVRFAEPATTSITPTPKPFRWSGMTESNSFTGSTGSTPRRRKQRKENQKLSLFPTPSQGDQVGQRPFLPEPGSQEEQLFNEMTLREVERHRREMSKEIKRERTRERHMEIKAEKSLWGKLKKVVVGCFVGEL